MTDIQYTKMFDGNDLAGISGPNGISQPDAGDFAFLAGSTAAAGWLATDRDPDGNRLERFKDHAATRLEGAAERATEARTAAQSEAAAARSAATAAGDASATVTAEAKAATKATEAAAKKVGGDAAARAGAKAATEMAEQAVKAASKKGIAESAAKLAAKKGAVLAARQLGTRAAAFAIGTAIPGPGWLVAGGVLIGSLIFDKDFRNMITGVFSSGMDINQPPAPPTTNWLPATDDNRMDDIAPADRRLTDLNNSVTGISPDTYKLWHLQDSEVTGLPTLEGPLRALDSAGTAITNLSNDYITALNGAPEIWGDTFREGRIGVAQNLGQFKDKAGNPVGEALSAAAAHSNEVYQGLREGNAKSREQLARSQGRFLGFIGGGSGTENLGANLDGLAASNENLKRAEEAMSAAGTDWMVKPVSTDDDAKPEVFKSIDAPATPEAMEPKPEPQIVAPAEPEPEAQEAKPAEPEPEPEAPEAKPDTPAVETPQVQMPQMSNPFAGTQQPSTPSLDDIMRNVPQVPQQPQEEPKIEDPKPEPEPEEEDKKIEDEKPDEPTPEPEVPEDPKPDDKGPEEPGEPKPEHAAPAPEDVAPAAPGDPKPAADPNAKPHEKTVVEVDGKPVDFKDPKIAAMVEGILNGEDGTPVPLRNAAEAAGIKLPGEDQDIGKVADPNSMEPGTVIAGKDGNYVYIGDDQVLGEDKKIRPLSEVAVFDGQHDGIFTLDTGSPAPGDVLQVADEKPLEPGAKPTDSGPQAPGVTPPAAQNQADQNGSPTAGNGSVFPTSPDKPIGLGGESNGTEESPEPVIVPNDSKPSTDLPAPADPGLPLSTDAPINPDAITP